ncbi:MAG: hypothetical protein ACP5UD_10355, partial [Conexivisphaera sp.]
DNKLKEWGVKLLIHGSPAIGERISTALEVARGEVIVHLDDDDLILPRKLQTVYERFSSDPKLGLLRNGILLINRVGRPFGISAPPSAMRASCSDARTLRRMIAHGLLFNSSSMAVRRSLVEDDPLLRRLEIALDSYYPILSLARGYDVALEPSVLSAYRLHGNQTLATTDSYEDSIARRASTAIKFVHNSCSILKYAGNWDHNCQELAEYLAAFHVLSALKSPMLTRAAVEAACGQRPAITRLLLIFIKYSQFSGADAGVTSLAFNAYTISSPFLPRAFKLALSRIAYSRLKALL